MYYEFQNQDCCTTYERSDLYRYLSPTRSPDDRSSSDHVRTIKRQRNRCLCSDNFCTHRAISSVYSTAIELNDNTFDVQVTVDSNHINSIELVNLSESTAAMYPLMEPALEELASQIYEKQSLEDITYEDDNKYTSMLLLEAIKSALAKASVLQQ